MKNRNIQIDTLRGFACILLVAFHVVGVNSTSGLRIDSGLYRDVSDILAYIRMPLFTFLSGIVYAYRPFSGNPAPYLKGKLRRLILPMLTVGTLFAIVQSLVQGTNSSIAEWHLLHIKPVAHFWFIEAIFLIFLVMIPLEMAGAFKTRKGFAVVLAIALLLCLSKIRYGYFSVSGALYLFPFFLLGMALQRFSITRALNSKHGVVLMAILFFLLVLVARDIVAVQAKRSALGLLLGFVACLGLLSLKAQSLILAKIGAFSYSIYLYHVFFTAGSRIALNMLGINDINVLFVSSLVAGVAGPVVTECFLNGTNTTRILLLGKPGADPNDLWLSKQLTGKITPASP